MSRRKSGFVAPPASMRTCCFCGLSEDNELEFGKFYEHDGIVTHYYCLLLSSNMEQKGNDNEGILGFLTEDIQKELRRGKRLLCSYCKRNGATLGCCNTKCKRIFHFPCGLRAGSLHQFFGEFRSYCISHRPKQKIDERVKKEAEAAGNTTCYICYEDVTPNDLVETLWATCCRKNAWFHRKCVQQLALSAGYFFKCPLCNNKKEFQKAMLDYGIFIPNQDASWELVPNAFQELLHRHDRCDAQECMCPKGRMHTSVNARWELILCRLCGSQGIHMACGHLKWANPVWECSECLTMLNKTGEVAPPTASKDNTTASDEYPSEQESTDSDVSVGRNSPLNTLDCEIVPSPVITKMKPGPRSFKLQQAEKVVKSLALANSTMANLTSTSAQPSVQQTGGNTVTLEVTSSSALESRTQSNKNGSVERRIGESLLIRRDSSTQKSISSEQSGSASTKYNQVSSDVILIDSDDDIVEIIDEKPKQNILTTKDGKKIEIHSLCRTTLNPPNVEGDVRIPEFEPVIYQTATNVKNACMISKISSATQVQTQAIIQAVSARSGALSIFPSCPKQNSASRALTNQKDNMAVIPAGSLQSLNPENKRDSDLVMLNENPSDSFMNIKITNVTSLAPEMFADAPEVPESSAGSEVNQPVELACNIPGQNTAITDPSMLRSSDPTTGSSVPRTTLFQLSTAAIKEINTKRKSDIAYVIDKNVFNAPNKEMLEQCKRLRMSDPGSNNSNMTWNIDVPVVSQSIPIIVTALQTSSYGSTVSQSNTTSTDSMANISTIQNMQKNNSFYQYVKSPVGNNTANRMDNPNSKLGPHQGTAKMSPTVQQSSVGSSAATDGFSTLQSQFGTHIYVRMPQNNAVIGQQAQAHCSTFSAAGPLQNTNLSNVLLNSQGNFVTTTASANQHVATSQSSGGIFYTTVPDRYLSLPTSSRGIQGNADAVSQVTVQGDSNHPISSGCDGDAGSSPAADAGHEGARAAEQPVDAAAQSLLLCTEQHGANPPSKVREEAGVGNSSGDSPVPSDISPSSTPNPKACCNSRNRPRLIPEKVCLRDLKFHVSGNDILQMVVFDTYAVNINVGSTGDQNAQGVTRTRNSTRFKSCHRRSKKRNSHFSESSLNPSLSSSDVPMQESNDSVPGKCATTNTPHSSLKKTKASRRFELRRENNEISAFEENHADASELRNGSAGTANENILDLEIGWNVPRKNQCSSVDGNLKENFDPRGMRSRRFSSDLEKAPLKEPACFMTRDICDILVQKSVEENVDLGNGELEALAAQSESLSQHFSSDHKIFPLKEPACFVKDMKDSGVSSQEICDVPMQTSAKVNSDPVNGEFEALNERDGTHSRNVSGDLENFSLKEPGCSVKHCGVFSEDIYDVPIQKSVKGNFNPDNGECEAPNVRNGTHSRHFSNDFEKSLLTETACFVKDMENSGILPADICDVPMQKTVKGNFDSKNGECAGPDERNGTHSRHFSSDLEISPLNEPKCSVKDVKSSGVSSREICDVPMQKSVKKNVHAVDGKFEALDVREVMRSRHFTSDFEIFPSKGSACFVKDVKNSGVSSGDICDVLMQKSVNGNLYPVNGEFEAIDVRKRTRSWPFSSDLKTFPSKEPTCSVNDVKNCGVLPREIRDVPMPKSVITNFKPVNGELDALKVRRRTRSWPFSSDIEIFPSKGSACFVKYAKTDSVSTRDISEDSAKNNVHIQTRNFWKCEECKCDSFKTHVICNCMSNTFIAGADEKILVSPIERSISKENNVSMKEHSIPLNNKLEESRGENDTNSCNFSNAVKKSENSGSFLCMKEANDRSILCPDLSGGDSENNPSDDNQNFHWKAEEHNCTFNDAVTPASGNIRVAMQEETKEICLCLRDKIVTSVSYETVGENVGGEFEMGNSDCRELDSSDSSRPKIKCVKRNCQSAVDKRLRGDFEMGNSDCRELDSSDSSRLKMKCVKKNCRSAVDKRLAGDFGMGNSDCRELDSSDSSRLKMKCVKKNCRSAVDKRLGGDFGMGNSDCRELDSSNTSRPKIKRVKKNCQSVVGKRLGGDREMGNSHCRELTNSDSSRTKIKGVKKNGQNAVGKRLSGDCEMGNSNCRELNSSDSSEPKIKGVRRNCQSAVGKILADFKMGNSHDKKLGRLNSRKRKTSCVKRNGQNAGGKRLGEDFELGNSHGREMDSLDSSRPNMKGGKRDCQNAVDKRLGGDFVMGNSDCRELDSSDSSKAKTKRVKKNCQIAVGKRLGGDCEMGNSHCRELNSSDSSRPKIKGVRRNCQSAVAKILADFKMGNSHDRELGSLNSRKRKTKCVKRDCQNAEGKSLGRDSELENSRDGELGSLNSKRPKRNRTKRDSENTAGERLGGDFQLGNSHSRELDSLDSSRPNMKGGKRDCQNAVGKMLVGDSEMGNSHGRELGSLKSRRPTKKRLKRDCQNAAGKRLGRDFDMGKSHGRELDSLNSKRPKMNRVKRDCQSSKFAVPLCENRRKCVEHDDALESLFARETDNCINEGMYKDEINQRRCVKVSIDLDKNQALVASRPDLFSDYKKRILSVRLKVEKVSKS